MKSLAYLICRFILCKDTLTATDKYFKNKFTFKIEDGVGRSIYKHGTYEDDLTTYLLKNCRLTADDIFLDIGANIGWYAVLLAQTTKATVYAFEPDTYNFTLLNKNIAQNKLKNIIPIQKAVSNENSEKTLYKYKNSNLGRHSLLPIHGGGSEQVGTTTLDNFLHSHDIDPNKVKFLKIDIEGYEYFALLGASNLLACSPFILMEFSPHFMSAAGYDPKILLTLMQKNGFSPYKLQSGNLSPVPFEELEKQKEQIDLFWKK